MAALLPGGRGVVFAAVLTGTEAARCLYCTSSSLKARLLKSLVVLIPGEW